MLYDSYLEHHGIKGMKWGVRRFQNEDGTLTKEGLEKYRQNEKLYNRAKAKQANAKAQYRSGEITKEEYTKTRWDARRAHNRLSKSYDELRKNNRIDKGKKLSDRGVTHLSNGLYTFAQNRGVRMLSNYAATIVSSGGENRLSRSIRNAGSAFIVANTFAAANASANLDAYRRYKRGE